MMTTTQSAHAATFAAKVGEGGRSAASARDHDDRVYRAIALQTSASMTASAKGAAPLDLARCAIRASLWNLGKRPGARCGLIEYAQRASVVARRQFPTAWPLHLTIDSAACDSSTAPADIASAFDAAADLFDGIPESIRAQAHVFTDGIVTFDGGRLESIAEELSALRATVVIHHMTDEVSHELILAAALMQRWVPVRVVPLSEMMWAMRAFRSATDRASGGRVDALPEYLNRVFDSLPEHEAAVPDAVEGASMPVFHPSQAVA